MLKLSRKGWILTYIIHTITMYTLTEYLKCAHKLLPLLVYPRITAEHLYHYKYDIELWWAPLLNLKMIPEEAIFKFSRATARLKFFLVIEMKNVMNEDLARST